jgi:hypothetical protein
MHKKIISNGFGSVRQDIRFTAPVAFRTSILALGLIDHISNDIGEDQGRDTFVWTRWTTQPDDDEIIVWELRLLLKDITESWEVLW